MTLVWFADYVYAHMIDLSAYDYCHMIKNERKARVTRARESLLTYSASDGSSFVLPGRFASMLRGAGKWLCQKYNL